MEWDDSDQPGERRTGVNSLLREERTNGAKIDELSDRIRRIEKQVAVMTERIKTLTIIAYGAVGMLGARVVGELLTLILHK